MNPNQRNALQAAASMIGEETAAAIVVVMDNRGTVSLQVHGDLMPIVFCERALTNWVTRAMAVTEVRRVE